MLKLLSIMLLTSVISVNVIIDFSPSTNLENWVVVDDVVMGGKSSGSFSLTPDGNGLFKGKVFLENNGGFSSVRYRFKRKSLKGFSNIVLKIKGDKKKYQFRIKSKSSTYYSFITVFETNGGWEEIILPLNEMYPSFRGRKLDKPNFSDDGIEEIAFLIANKNQEEFQLLIDSVKLR